MKLIHADLAVLKYCNRGSREFCVRHGINWQSFVQHGIDVKELEKIDDAMLVPLLAQARQRSEREEV